MDIGLVMLVKDEARRVEACLAPLLGQLAEVVVVDTGSTDGTPDLLRTLGVEPRFDRLDPDRCGALSDARNRALRALSTPWRLSLDADERLDPDALRSLRRLDPSDEVGGLIVPWETVTEGGERWLDYKCAFFRTGIEKVGLIHDHVQPSLRARGLRGAWVDGVVLHHRPEARKDGWKQRSYADRLACAMAREPEVPRYAWFAGYVALREDRLEAARRLLARALEPHALWPVEGLNAGMALAEVEARAGEAAACVAVLERTLARHRQLAGDWEVAVNRRMGPWLEEALDAARAGALEAVRTYRFAC